MPSRTRCALTTANSRHPRARACDAWGLPEQISVLADALVGSLASAAPIDEAVVAGIRWLARHPHGRVEQLGKWMGISNRQLQRRFLAAVGYGPKTFQSILRFQRVLDLAGAPCGHRDLADWLPMRATPIRRI
jgi:uncharacterized protein (DUF2384 family)